MRIAVPRRFANRDGVRESDFFTVVAWRQSADFCNKYLTKGRRVAVEGSLQTRQYDAKDGSKRTVYEIIADSVEAAGPAPEWRQGGNNAQPQDNGNETFTEVDDDELPF
jgi:single-strand DNA-binding protein